MFKIQELNRPETAIWLNKLETILSNDGKGDIQLKKGFMQEQVCSVRISSEDEKLFLVDLTFNQDIFINDHKIAKGSRAELQHEDILRIGESDFEVFNPSLAIKRLSSNQLVNASWELIGLDNWLQGQSFKVRGKTVLGRDKSCDITIPGSHLSRRHAELFVAGDKLLVKDLGSANGTFLNGEPITESRLRHGDEIRFDQLTFKVESPEAEKNSRFNAKQVIAKQAEKPAEQKPAAQKQWVTKPTSVGNQLTDSDLLLAKHRRSQRITFIVFGTAIAIAIISTVVWTFRDRLF